jgi:hypothetical protein
MSASDPKRTKMKVNLSPGNLAGAAEMAAISGNRANDERVKCLRIFADSNGETHVEDIDITLQPRKLFNDNPPLRLSQNLPASWYNICYVPTGMGEVNWHNPP